MNRGIRVIVGDDDANDRYFLQQAFKNVSPEIKVDFAANGEEVIRYLQEKSEPKPSLLIIDSMMIKMNGFDVLKWMRTRSEFKELPVIMLTGQLSENNANRAREFGVKAYLEKPDSLAKLQALVEELGQKYLRLKS